MRFLALTFLLWSACFAFAQQTHNHMSTVVIDGSKHPEQIPDSTALRLWLEATTPPSEASPEQVKVQDLHASSAVEFSNLSKFHEVTREFRRQFDVLVNEYNSRPHNDSSEFPEFEAKLNQLVLDTMNRLRTELGDAGYEKLQAHVNREKAHMHVSIAPSGGGK